MNVLRGLLSAGLACIAIPAHAARIDIHGPPGSVAFGAFVRVLPNGNFVVIDPDGSVSSAGAVYLYSPSGTLISTLTGSSPNDHVGSGGAWVVGDSNFAVRSPLWNNAGAPQASAITWVNGTTGLSGVVSSGNSLVGTTTGDTLGLGGIITLNNGNYVVLSWVWNNGVAGSGVGAVTWGNGNSGISGAVSAGNSLVGTTTNDRVGSAGLTVLSNGNYVVKSGFWNNGVYNNSVGAVTWGDGSSGITGVVSGGNSLIGATKDDSVGNIGVTALSNGNYVVASSNWNNGIAGSVFGAVTWANGSSGITGPVSAVNSLIGTHSYDRIGAGGVTALSNGNYVVASSSWRNGAGGVDVGAVTWGYGSSGTTGTVSASNSLTGTTTSDEVGTSVVALSNGNYVVASPYWNNGVPSSKFGAATWCDGSGATSGTVSAGNSLFGTTANDNVGSNGVTALSNGNYVVGSSSWNNGAAAGGAGAATWGNGNGGISGAVSSSNSLLGTASGDSVGSGGVAALNNGNYLVISPDWSNGAPPSNLGAVTWGDGSSGVAGPVSASNSLVGTAANDRVGSNGATVLSNGGYVIASNYWNNGAATSVGAVTWSNGAAVVGPVLANNSLVGASSNDSIGDLVGALSDGNYVVYSSHWSGNLGAVTLVNGQFRMKGTIGSWNSVLGMAANGGAGMNSGYDPVRHQLVVGRPAENIVSLFTMDQIFASDFDQ